MLTFTLAIHCPYQYIIANFSSDSGASNLYFVTGMLGVLGDRSKRITLASVIPCPAWQPAGVKCPSEVSRVSKSVADLWNLDTLNRVFLGWMIFVEKHGLEHFSFLRFFFVFDLSLFGGCGTKIETLNLEINVNDVFNSPRLCSSIF